MFRIGLNPTLPCYTVRGKIKRFLICRGGEGEYAVIYEEGPMRTRGR
jgi:hypothetical protein